jgi:hypothetical protein
MRNSDKFAVSLTSYATGDVNLNLSANLTNVLTAPETGYTIMIANRLATLPSICLKSRFDINLLILDAKFSLLWFANSYIHAFHKTNAQNKKFPGPNSVQI